MRKVWVIFLKLLLTIAVLGVSLKLLTYVPVKNVPGFLEDGVVYLQRVERNIEEWLVNFAETFQLVAVKRERDRRYEKLYKQQAAESALLQAMAHENKLLREALRFQRGYAGGLISAEVVGRSADHWFRFVTVSKGSRSGVSAYMAAIDAQGLAGYVSEAGQDSARIILITDPLVNISCVNERTGEIYIVTGKDNGNLELKYATLHSDIREGDRLLTSGYSYRYKRGLPVGVITRVDQGQKNLAKRVSVKPLANISGLDIVFFIR